MDIRNVYIIFNSKELTKEQVVRELQEEGYNHNFFFGNIRNMVIAHEYLKQSDEVWCFGKCDDIEDYMRARELGKDIWQMQ